MKQVNSSLFFTNGNTAHLIGASRMNFKYCSSESSPLASGTFSSIKLLLNIAKHPSALLTFQRHRNIRFVAILIKVMSASYRIIPDDS
jgi:hypothetical protein